MYILKWGNNVLRSTEKSLLVSRIAKDFQYAECTDCHQIVNVARSAQVELLQWKFSLMGLRPSLLGVAKGLCRVCQDMREQFHGVLSQ